MLSVQLYWERLQFWIVQLTDFNVYSLSIARCYVIGLPTCTDFRGTYRFLPLITISRFHAVVYRFWKMREFLGLADLAPTASQGAALPL